MKKTLAILLSLALVVCMIPAASGVAFAADTLTADISATSALYSGEAITLPTISNVKYGNTSVTETGSDAGKYSVTWANSAKEPVNDGKVTAADTYTATISYLPTGESQTPVTITKTFTVAKVDPTKASATYNGYFEKNADNSYSIGEGKLTVKQGDTVIKDTLYSATTDTTKRSGYVQIGRAHV